jgi:homoserine kinase type II
VGVRPEDVPAQQVALRSPAVRPVVDCLVVTAPLLSMLWESADPADALSRRFGFADPASAVGWIGDALQDAWGIAVDDCDRLVISAGNLLAWITAGDRRLIAKWSVVPELFARLAGTAALTMWLQARGIPVAAPVPATDGRLRVQLNNVSLGVCPVIDGDLLDASDQAQVNEAGRMLAALHDAMAAYPGRVDGGPSSGHGQLVHNDFRSANILRDGTSITAVLDFEEVTYRTRVADLAKAAVLLGTRYHDWAPTSQPVREAFVAAYHDHAPLTSAEQNELQRGITAVEKHLGWA